MPYPPSPTATLALARDSLEHRDALRRLHWWESREKDNADRVARGEMREPVRHATDEDRPAGNVKDVVHTENRECVLKFDLNLSWAESHRRDYSRLGSDAVLWWTRVGEGEDQHATDVVDRAEGP